MTPGDATHPPARTSCPGCGSSLLGDSLFLARQPVILNYRFPTKDAAKGVARRDMELRECQGCGLVFNAILDASAIPYDERYENRQNFSRGFLSMLEQTADTLAKRYDLAGGSVLEIGCGKGDFLTLLCERANARGVGYDTSYEEAGTRSDGRVSFIQRYVTADDVTEKVDLVVCRHVVEHVPEIGEFFRLLLAIAAAGGNSAVYVETPALEWVVEHRAFWDVFYEHCNYFPVQTLRALAEQAGFEVLDHRLIFGDQYQALELRPRAASAPSVAPLSPTRPVLLSLAESFTTSCKDLQVALENAGARPGWAIWGAGAKGVSLANRLLEGPPAFVIDSNPAKQGMFLPGTGIPVISPDDERIAAIPVILVANANYVPEIRATLSQHGWHPELISV